MNEPATVGACARAWPLAAHTELISLRPCERHKRLRRGGFVRPSFLSDDPKEVAMAYVYVWKAAVFICHALDKQGRCTCKGRSVQCTPGKHPAVRFTTEATSDFVELHRRLHDDWWGNPTFNWGVATGEASGLVVIDVDGPVGAQSLARQEERFGSLPICPRVRSGRVDGGEHLYFRLPPGAPVPPNGASRLLGEAVDVRGHHGYVVIPGSRHKSGRRYAWAEGLSPDDVSLPDLPSAWLAHLNSGRTAAGARSSQGTRGAPRPKLDQDHDRGSLLLGDGPGRAGFHGPIYRWACKYIHEEERNACNELFKTAIRAAIVAAPKSASRDPTILVRYTSDEYLDEQLNNARKFVLQ